MENQTNIPELLAQVQLKNLIEQYVLLEERDNGEWWGSSPFSPNGDKTPSFSVDPNKQLFYDFSTGQGGDALTFIKLIENCGTRAAIEKLKAYVGYDETAPTRKMLQATKVAKTYRPPRPPTSKEVSAHLSNNYMQMFERDLSKLKLWLDEGILLETLDKFEVRFDAWSNRLVFPIRTLDGKILTVSGRTLDEDWKIKKTSKYIYLHKFGELRTLYGLYENRNAIEAVRQIICVEGAKSVMLLDSWGIYNSVALLTSHLNAHQYKLLVELGVPVVFALDKEVDIRQDKNIQKLKHFANVSYIYDKENLLEPKMSPFDDGREVWKTLYERRQPL